MKIFSTIIFILILIFFQSAFAVSAKTLKEQQEAKQKMTQLQQLLERAAQSNVEPESTATEMPTVSPAGIPAPTPTIAEIMPSSNSAPYAGVLSSPASVNQEGTTEKILPENSVNSMLDKTSLYDQAFSGVVNQMLPMTPAQIAKLREVFTESQMAAATPPGIPPKPTSTSLLVNLSPQATPPVIRLSAGYITSLVFVDATGQPWPISVYSIGDPSAFNIQWDRKSNTLLVQALTYYKRCNLAVMLRDLNTPVMITLISGQEAVDYRVDLRVPGIGPNAIFSQSGLPGSASPILLEVLNGVPPKGSKELRVRGGDCQAWLLDKKLYLRTRLTVTSPGWQAIMSSIDGTHAYKLQPSPVILALQNGSDKILTLMLEGLD